MSTATTEQPKKTAKRQSRTKLTIRRFARNRLALVGLAVMVILFLMAYIGPLVNKYDYLYHDYMAFNAPPGGDHWWGTNQGGQDLFALTMRGLQKSLVIGLLVGVISTLVAGAVGAFAAYYGGWADRILMWIVDLLLVLPSFLLVAVMSPAFQKAGWLIFVVLLSAFSWMITGRVVRSMTLTLKDREFVKAAKYMGVSGPVIIFRHILPSMASLLIIDTVIQVGAAVIGESGLSYFGFGIQAPDVSLGTIISDNTTNAPAYPWLFYFPAGCLVLIGVAVSFIGDGLRDALDPNASGAKAKAKKIKTGETKAGATNLSNQLQGPTTSTDVLSPS
ncbi:ABC transporter permease [Kitasatospora sp. GP82]|uniref:ABC transporter permease n=1 Tax=Kitasatospora sp. GP82 TaxID=3035089 RepID=UPI002475660E|nr:ABC transporter permease [Kitasatospora sp. GP82]MDH6123226.1 peptide/nickel transport system permease protein [Kitasatospora sp. GP82]